MLLLVETFVVTEGVTPSSASLQPLVHRRFATWNHGPLVLQSWSTYNPCCHVNAGVLQGGQPVTCDPQAHERVSMTAKRLTVLSRQPMPVYASCFTQVFEGGEQLQLPAAGALDVC